MRFQQTTIAVVESVKWFFLHLSWDIGRVIAGSDKPMSRTSCRVCPRTLLGSKRGNPTGHFGDSSWTISGRDKPKVRDNMPGFSRTLPSDERKWPGRSGEPLADRVWAATPDYAALNLSACTVAPRVSSGRTIKRGRSYTRSVSNVSPSPNTCCLTVASVQLVSAQYAFSRATSSSSVPAAPTFGSLLL